MIQTTSLPNTLAVRAFTHCPSMLSLSIVNLCLVHNLDHLVTTISLAGKLHFVKFETAKIMQAMDFIKANCLHMFRNGSKSAQEVVRIKATGGGAFKFADIFQVPCQAPLHTKDSSINMS